ncbi:hypothetical protein BOTNAR_0147g00140 [Botryotinia narcissicola]|uniref:Uncharacterized protein n=1 Tax=Botryotinia narcissicola TaxID=278944 RepID=A0A4Z1IIE1_9HELO|nr:hypothetical protein BOTNAR_0147g00140 [Botryotinia narcissicola]
MSPKPESIPSLYSLSGASSINSIISTPTNRSASPSPSLITTTPPPSEFIFPIPFSGDPSETSPLLANRPRLCRVCNCRHPNHIHGTASTPQPSSMQFRHCSIQRSSLLNIQIISGVLSIFCLAIIVLCPFSSRAENDTSTIQRDVQSPDENSSLTSLHSFSGSINTDPSDQAQTHTRTHKLDTPQLKGIEFAILRNE